MKKVAYLFAPLLAMSLVACGGHKEVELTSEQFMQKVQAEPGIKTLPSGLAYRVIKSGEDKGPTPAKGDNMMLEYEGRLPDGYIFDSSEHHGGLVQMPLDGLIPGWMEILPKMHSGDIWQVYIPSQLAYGEKSMGLIPANSALVFRIHLLGVTKSN